MNSCCAARRQGVCLRVFLFSVGLLAMVGLISSLRTTHDYDLGLIQALAVVPVFILASKILICGVRIPKLMLLIACVLALAGAVISRRPLFNPQKAFVVHRFQGDPYEAETSLFRDQVNVALDGYAAGNVEQLKAVASARSPESEAQVRRFLRHHNQSSFTVWGSEKLLRISFAEREPLPLASLAAGVLPAGIGSFRLMSSPVVSGLAYNRYHSALFLGVLARGILPLGEQGTEAGLELFRGADAPGAETWLLDAAAVLGFWNSTVHRAVPFLLLGNRSLQLAVSGAGGIIDKGELLCAIKYYDQAKLEVSQGKNFELLATILNNQGVARLLLALVTNVDNPRKPAGSGAFNEQQLKKALKSFQDTTLYGRVGDRFEVPRVAYGVGQENLLLLQGLQYQEKKQRMKAMRTLH